MQRSRLSAHLGFRCLPHFPHTGFVFSMSISGPSQCAAPLLYPATKNQLWVPCFLLFPLFLFGLFHPAARQREPRPCPVLSFSPILPSSSLLQHSENRRELMFILVTPMSLSGLERLKELTRGKSQKRSASSSLSSSSYVASLSMRWWRWQVCSIFSLLMSLRSRMSCLASCWSCRRISAWNTRRRVGREEVIGKGTSNLVIVIP